jgi:hypothetical protein
MPIPSTAPSGLTTTTPLPIICPACKDASSCPKHRCNKVLTKSCETVERELKTRASVEQPRRAPSLACRTADEQWVDISNQRLKSTQLGALYPGSKFKGVQKSGKTSYEVAVKIQVSRMHFSICRIVGSTWSKTSMLVHNVNGINNGITVYTGSLSQFGQWT